MDIKQLKVDLSNACVQFHFYTDEVERLRQEIALKLCPLKIGDDVTIESFSKNIKIKIDTIRFHMDLVEQFGCSPDQEIS